MKTSEYALDLASWRRLVNLGWSDKAEICLE